MRRFSQRNSLVTLSDINITPLLDLAFVLLIIFVITTPLLEQGLNLKLPTGDVVDLKKIDPKDVRTVEVGTQGFLALVLVFGSAFFVAHQPPRDYSSLRVIPSRFVDGLSGGGGNPKLPDTNEKQRGDPNAVPNQAETKPKPKPPEPVQKPEVKPPEPKVIKEPVVLKPVVRKTTDKPKTDETEAKPVKNARAEAKARAAGAKIAQQLAKAKEGLQ